MELKLDDLKNLLQLLSYTDDDSKNFFDQSVDPALAEDCIKDYIDVYKKGDLAEIKKAYTETITFAAKGLSKWLLEVSNPKETDTNNIKICLGIYNDGMVATYPNNNIKKGRVTAFLWPYNKDEKAVYLTKGSKLDPKPVPPFNIGSLYP